MSWKSGARRPGLAAANAGSKTAAGRHRSAQICKTAAADGAPSRAGAVGVAWGYHDAHSRVQHGAHEVIDRVDDLHGVLEGLGKQGW